MRIPFHLSPIVSSNIAFCGYKENLHNKEKLGGPVSRAGVVNYLRAPGTGPTFPWRPELNI